MPTNSFSNMWWLFLLRGLIAVLFGFAALLLPAAMLLVFVWLLGAYLFVDGAFSVVSAVKAKKDDYEFISPLFEGLLSMVVGCLAFIFPDTTQIALIFCLGLWAIAAGALRLLNGFRMRRYVKDTLGVFLSGLAYLTFGVILLIAPLTSAVALMWCIGIWAIIAGVALVYFAFRLKP